MLRLGMSRWGAALRAALNLGVGDCLCKTSFLLLVGGATFWLWPATAQPETLLREIAPRQSISSVKSTGKPPETNRKLGGGRSTALLPEQMAVKPAVLSSTVPRSLGMVELVADPAHKHSGSQNEMNQQRNTQGSKQGATKPIGQPPSSKEPAPEESLSAKLRQEQYDAALPIAETLLREAETKYAQDSDIVRMRRLDLAILYERLDYLEKSLQLYQRLHSQDLLDRKARASRHAVQVPQQSLLDQGKITEEIESLKRANPKSAIALEKMAKRYDEILQRMQPVASLSTEAEQNPFYVEAFARLNAKMGNYKEAIELYQEEIRVRADLEKAEIDRRGAVNQMPQRGLSPLGRASLDLITVYAEYGEYEKAKALLSQWNARFEEWAVPQRAEFARKYVEVLLRLGNYEDAERCLKRLFNERNRMKQDGRDIFYLNRLGTIYKRSGQYKELSYLFRNEVAIPGRDPNPKLLASEVPFLNELGKFQQELGMYASARHSFERARHEFHLGAEHPALAVAIANLGQLAQQQGDYAEAERFLKQSSLYVEKRLGSDHPEAAAHLVNLGKLYSQWGKTDPDKYEKARVVYEQALRLRERRLLPGHLSIWDIQLERTRLLLQMGQFSDAESVIREAVRNQQVNPGLYQQDLGMGYLLLADVRFEQGDYSDALFHYQHALSLLEKSFGRKNSSTGTALIGLGRAAVLQGQSDVGLAYLRRAAALENEALPYRLGIVRANRKLELLDEADGTRDLVIAVVERYFGADEAAKRFAMELLLSRKGLVFEDEALLQLTTAEDLPGGARYTWVELKRKKAANVMHPAVEEFRSGFMQGSEARLEEQETQLTVHSRVYAQGRFDRAVTIAQIAKTLPPNAVLIEFVKVRDVVDSVLEHQQTRSHYLGFVLRPDQTISIVNLGDGAKLDASIEEFRQSVVPETDLETALEKVQDLYERIWSPIKGTIHTALSVILSPDGLLNFVPFAGLQNPEDGKFTVEQWAISYVTSGRDLIPYQRNLPWFVGPPPPSDFVLVADPVFNAHLKLGMAGVMAMFFDLDQKKFLDFKALPKTLEEVEAVSHLMQQLLPRQRILTKEAAREETILAVRRPRILHLATHGFFVSHSGNPSLDRRENVLLRSGLAVAGANSFHETLSHIDGLLTADEVSGMDLQDTDVVVLSACQTGVGEAKNGEGVYGLRRAFSVAGAKNLVMSLWRVSDEWTARQMIAFYKYYSEGKLPVDALRAAQLEMISKLRQSGVEAFPALWAAFIVQGAAIPVGATP